jgi:hypothetical protein
MNEAIKILKIEQVALDRQYEETNERLRLAKKFGKASELEDLRRDEAVSWVRLSLIIKLIEKLEHAYQMAGN